jgi:hypothetical protein
MIVGEKRRWWASSRLRNDAAKSLISSRRPCQFMKEDLMGVYQRNQ